MDERYGLVVLGDRESIHRDSDGADSLRWCFLDRGSLFREGWRDFERAISRVDGQPDPLMLVDLAQNSITPLKRLSHARIIQNRLDRVLWYVCPASVFNDPPRFDAQTDDSLVVSTYPDEYRDEPARLNRLVEGLEDLSSLPAVDDRPMDQLARPLTQLDGEEPGSTFQVTQVDLDDISRGDLLIPETDDHPLVISIAGDDQLSAPNVQHILESVRDKGICDSDILLHTVIDESLDGSLRVGQLTGRHSSEHLD